MITVQTWRINVKGVVQGVGFRPFVYQMAQECGLSGWVRNTSGDVTILVEGPSHCLEQFLNKLRICPPPQAHVESILVSEETEVGHKYFEIRDSLVDKDEYQLISPDLATCPACKAEIINKTDRRFRYAFTNCTNCGPRFTIIEDIPYDRPRTTMRNFKMCQDCQKEYEDPLNRRFHAQPNACPECGPRLELVDSAGKIVHSQDVVADACLLLRAGNILAIKGLGGFLLTCDATNDEAVRRLRARKKRPAKPFAIMLKDLVEVNKRCWLNQQEKELITSPASPIVLLESKPEKAISVEVAPGLKHLGVMLPYTPLHHLLMNDTGFPLVMTSGNLSEEPIAKDNGEALRRLHDIADYFILHNRDIYSCYDDSVTLVEQGKPLIIRRARGFAPYPIYLPFQSRAVLACGAELKNTFCLTHDNHAFLSQHIGDMENAETLEHFESTVRLYEKLFRIQPEAVVCDMHPDYLSTKWAETEAIKNNLLLVRIQHHHAHIVSCMVDNGIQEPVIGVAFDGTGYGTDGHIWGSEFMVADDHTFQRKAHFEYLPLPGGNAAIGKPYRTAIGYLYSLIGENALHLNLPCLNGVDQSEVEVIKRQVDRNINTPLTSSCGRLFDAVSSLLGIRHQVEYEGQAAVELEMAADESGDNGIFPFQIEDQDGVKIIKLREMFFAIISSIKQNMPVSVMAMLFHNTIASMISQLCVQLSFETGIKMVVLSGGVYQNRRLLNQVVNSLSDAGLTPLIHNQVPCNDGGISLGQAVIANFNKAGE